MAIIVGGITGSIQGRIGPVIGEIWKGVNYLKLYRKPKDPRSASQLEQRNRFVECNLFMTRMPYIILSHIIPHFSVKIPPRAVFTQWNLMVFDTVDYPSNLILSKGTLEPMTGIDATYDSGPGHVNVTWNFVPVGFQEPTDTVAIMMLASDNGKWSFTDFMTTLTTGYVDIEIGAGKSDFTLSIWAVLSRGGLLSLELLSNSTFQSKYFA